jgi:ATP-dependent DNA ligase
MPGKNVPFPPMEAELVRELPEGDWQYEPKWDGFRGVLENDGGELALWSRNERPLLRYFPELRPLGDLLPPHSALDGEIVIERDGRLEFDLMQMRLHPAESRIRRLSAEIPAQFIAFDLLLWKGKPVHELPLEKRRRELEKVAKGFRLSPTTRDRKVAAGWLDGLDAIGLDGVIAKRLGMPYRPGSREAVAKVKAHKTADCVVIGVRWKAKPTTLATLLLGLYRDDGDLDYVGSAAVAAGKHAEILKLITPLLKNAPERGFSEPNRWGGGELEQSALQPKLVVEVRYDKVQGNRFRHGTRLIRFRQDKDPGQCTWREVRQPPRPGDLTVSELLGPAPRSAKRG